MEIPVVAPIRQDRDAAGELLIWTDIDPAHEADFNRWYDREHMAERAAIEGFAWSRRYRACGGARPYLALYRTDSLHVFESAAYRQAFEHQTRWSLDNFARMRNTRRRVAAVSLLGGAGTGAALGLLRLADTAIAQCAAELAHEALARDGILALRVLTPDPALSTPLPSEESGARLLEPMLLLEATHEAAAHAALAWLADALQRPADAAHTFQLLWNLDAAELRAAAQTA